ncbi:MAG: hypothetical protein ACRCYQ_07505 [Nocardioides sp.]
MTRVITRRLAATLTTILVTGFMTVVGTGALLAAPAHAAACSGSTGVTVVVDFKQLGGGVAQGCDSAGGGKAASSVFPAAGFPLTYVQRSPGFVCKVSGKPSTSCVNTPPATAYWSLWWSDGKSGTWTYSAVGVGSLKVPSGGYLAFSWQGQAAKAAPGVTPARRAAAPAPSSPSSSRPDPTPDDEPSTGSGSSGSGGGTSPSKSPNGASSTSGGSSAPAGQGGDDADGGASDEADGGATDEADDGGTDEADQADERSSSGDPDGSGQTPSTGTGGATDTETGDGSVDVELAAAESGNDAGSPAWLAVGVLMLILVGIGCVVWTRRKGSMSS